MTCIILVSIASLIVLNNAEMLPLQPIELKNDFSIVDLKPYSINCQYPSQLGDVIKLELSTYSPEAENFFREKFGSVIDHVQPSNRKTVQNCVIGKHHITPLNQGLVGMCQGNRRRIGIPLMGSKIFYEVYLLEIKKHRSNVKHSRSDL